MANGNTVLQGYMGTVCFKETEYLNTIHSVEGREQRVNVLEDPRLPD